MKRTNLGLILAVLILACSPKSGEVITSSSSEKSLSNTPIETTLDLVNLDRDRVKVTINPGKISSDSILFRLPRVIQGTYDISDFGLFIDDFKAFNYDGEEIGFNIIDENSWMIDNSSGLDRFQYYVNDTFDIETSEVPTPFSPSGTNIDPTVFILNLHGFVGYFEGRENLEYTISVISDADLMSSSALPRIDQKWSVDSSQVTDTYLAERYFEVTDNPMMYGLLEIEDFMVGDIRIVLSVFSPNKVHSAADIRETVFDMMEAQKEYLGDMNSTSRYDIFLHLPTTEANQAQGFGALEHHTSTVVVLPEWLNEEALEESMIDVVSHEFFHIVTPLTVHSEDIHNFDYYAPTFSKHLWMYEGITEYFASHFQVYEGLQTQADFYQKMEGKIQYSLSMDDAMSFTEMSENVLDEPYSSNYINVYMKGALIGMCIDILMREESNGERSLLSLMKELSTKYGMEKPFEDDAFIEEITAMTYPSVGDFLQTHVVGNTPINYSTYFSKVGLTANQVVEPTSFFFLENEIQRAQTPFIDVNPATNEVFFVGELNSSLLDLGVQNGDIIKEMNGIEVNLQTIYARGLIPLSFSWTADTKISMTLERSGELITIDGVVGEPSMMRQKLRENLNATADQVQLRSYWLQK